MLNDAQICCSVIKCLKSARMASFLVYWQQFSLKQRVKVKGKIENNQQMFLITLRTRAVPWLGLNDPAKKISESVKVTERQLTDEYPALRSFLSSPSASHQIIKLQQISGAVKSQMSEEHKLSLWGSPSMFSSRL